MPDFQLKETPSFGTCLTCGTSSDPDGFVEMISEVKVVRDNYDISGVVDMILCSKCIEQAALLVGALSKEESFNLGDSLNYYQNAYEKAADEAASWQQRYENLVEIMSLLELQRNVDPDYSASGGASGEPSPDLRVQEGSTEALQSDGKNTTPKRKQRDGANRQSSKH